MRRNVGEVEAPRSGLRYLFWCADEHTDFRDLTY